MAGASPSTWRVKFKVEYLFPEPGIPDVLLQLQETLGADLLNTSSDPGVLSILLRVDAVDQEAAREHALNLLRSALAKIAVGTPAVTETEVSSEERPHC